MTVEWTVTAVFIAILSLVFLFTSFGKYNRNIFTYNKSSLTDEEFDALTSLILKDPKSISMNPTTCYYQSGSYSIRFFEYDELCNTVNFLKINNCDNFSIPQKKRFVKAFLKAMGKEPEKKPNKYDEDRKALHIDKIREVAFYDVLERELDEK